MCFALDGGEISSIITGSQKMGAALTGQQTCKEVGKFMKKQNDANKKTQKDLFDNHNDSLSEKNAEEVFFDDMAFDFFSSINEN